MEIKSELLRSLSHSPQNSFDTIYFGGGTPSVLDGIMIENIMQKTFSLFTIENNAEITIEANPGTITREKLCIYKGAGINRINLGVQSFNDDNLKFLGRIHDAKQAQQALSLAGNQGFVNIGLDLIYGLPGQTSGSWQADLEKAVSFSPEHISCYMLTYESGTPLDRARQKKVFVPLPDDKNAELFDMTAEFLKTHGYLHYEISNFAKSESFKSRHNQKYWTFVPYLGFGPSAHSFLNNERMANISDLKTYIDSLLKFDKLPVTDRETLTREQKIIETIYLGLRTCDGIDIKRFEKISGMDFNETFDDTITDLKKKGFMINIPQKKCGLTQKGMRFLDSISSIMIDHDFG